MYLVGKVKTVYTDGPSWDAVKLCRTLWGAIKECLTDHHFYVKSKGSKVPEGAEAVFPRLVKK